MRGSHWSKHKKTDAIQIVNWARTHPVCNFPVSTGREEKETSEGGVRTLGKQCRVG